MNYFPTSSVLCFFFFDARVFVFRRQSTLFMHCLYTIYETHNYFIQKKKNIKNESYGTIHTFKIYFVTVFSVFSKINCIQMDPNSACLPSRRLHGDVCYMWVIGILFQGHLNLC